MAVNVPRVGVGVFVWKDGKFLMGQRIGKHGQGSWSVPGGWLEHRESFEDCAKREIAEETGMEIAGIAAFLQPRDELVGEMVRAWMVDEDTCAGTPAHKVVTLQRQ